MNDRNALARGMAEAYMDGAVTIPYALLRMYRVMRLTDSEGMLLFHLIAFKQLEQNEFPTIEQLQERMGASSTVVGQAVQKLMKLGFITIDEVFDPITDVQSERYNLHGLYDKMAKLMVSGGDQSLSEERAGSLGNGSVVEQSSMGLGAAAPVATLPPNLFGLFEQEFGRPLTPMEVETINGWLDQDKYADELIRFALKESVFSGKLNFRYIDRILLEWSRNRVTNVEEARLHAQKFRAGR